MIKSLLERFNIPTPDNLDKYNLIGLDFGDGEISAAIPSKETEDDPLTVINLFFDDGHTRQKNMNVYLFFSDGAKLVSGTMTHLEEAYYNFKRCPNTSECKNHYLRDDGTEDAKTYAGVMSEGFNAAVREIFKHNPDDIDPKKETIILVGRPSSEYWAKNEKDYAKILELGLNLKELTDKAVHVAIQPESWAAMAWEASQRNIQAGEVIVVLDNGSSTFDITVINRKGLMEGGTGEDSFQFGGNLLDENLLRLMWDDFYEQHSECKPHTPHGHKLGLRICKERYYGEDGTEHNSNFYPLQFDLPSGKTKKFPFPVDEETMSRALNEVQTVAFHAGHSVGSVTAINRITPKSWLASCEEVYRSFYKKMLPLFKKNGSDTNHPGVPHHVVLSGGVSVMPEVQKVAEKVFGQKPKLTGFPNYTVSRGLAYILGCEILKAQYLKDLLRTLDNDILPNASSLRTQIISAGVDEDWNTFKKAIENWADTYIEKSIKDFDAFHSEVFNRDLSRPVQKGAENWYNANNMQTKINQMLRQKFQAMFPQFVADFNYPLPPMHFDALSGVVVYITINYSFFFGWMTANEDDKSILSDSSLTEKRDRTWRQEAKNIFLDLKDEICDGGSKKIKYDGKGFFGGLHDFIFGRNGTTVSYKGLKNMYGEELTYEKVTNIRKQILGILKERMKEHVERITPYFNMSMTAEVNR